MSSVTVPGEEGEEGQSMNAEGEVKDGLIKPGQELPLGFTVRLFIYMFAHSA